MNDRILSLRKTLTLSQEKFGEKLGIGKSAVSRMEIGTYKTTETMVKLICSTFNTNEEWLRTGKGEMFVTKNADDQLAWLIGELHATDDEFAKKLIVEFLKLSDNQRNSVKQFVAKLATSIN